MDGSSDGGVDGRVVALYTENDGPHCKVILSKVCSPWTGGSKSIDAGVEAAYIFEVKTYYSSGS